MFREATRFGLMAAAIFSISGVARAQMPEIGQQDVMSQATVDAVAQCIASQTATVEAALSCMDRPDVTDGARALARAIITTSEFGLVGLLDAFTETGDVDIARVFFPSMANTNWQEVLVNGEGAPLMAADLHFRQNPPLMPGTRAILARHPRAFESGRVVVTAVRMLPEGMQMFVLSDVVTDGCRACEPVAEAIRYVFFRSGLQVGFQEIGWQPALVPPVQADYYDRLLRGNVALLQARLNELGYDAGVVDGRAGPQTRSALEDFRRDHCLPPGGAIRAADVDILAFTRDVYGGAACAPGRGGEAVAPTSLPLPAGVHAPASGLMPGGIGDGVYATDPAACPHLDASPRTPAQQAAAQTRVSLRDGHFTQSGQTCRIRDHWIEADHAYLEMICDEGGSARDASFEMWPLDPGVFLNGEELYRVCPEVVMDAPAATAEVPAPANLPVSGPGLRITTNFGAFGPGPDDDPDAYIAGQFHVATDIAAVPGSPVVAPVAGDIVYYHRRGNAFREPRWLQTFVVFRDRDGRDWIFGHVDCTRCPAHPPVGDADVWPDSHIVRDIAAGETIGQVADLGSEGFGNHLHLGIVARPIVEEGRLNALYHGGNWARLTYAEGVPGGVEGARALAEALGFIDPIAVLSRP